MPEESKYVRNLVSRYRFNVENRLRSSAISENGTPTYYYSSKYRVVRKSSKKIGSMVTNIAELKSDFLILFQSLHLALLKTKLAKQYGHKPVSAIALQDQVPGL